MFRKADTAQLKKMLEGLDKREKELQERFGDRFPGSIRSVSFHNANAIRRTIKEIENIS